MTETPGWLLKLEVYGTQESMEDGTKKYTKDIKDKNAQTTLEET
jgi:hypothetical protein